MRKGNEGVSREAQTLEKTWRPMTPEEPWWNVRVWRESGEGD